MGWIHVRIIRPYMLFICFYMFGGLLGNNPVILCQSLPSSLVSSFVYGSSYSGFGYYSSLMLSLIEVGFTAIYILLVLLHVICYHPRFLRIGVVDVVVDVYYLGCLVSLLQLLAQYCRHSWSCHRNHKCQHHHQTGFSINHNIPMLCRFHCKHRK